MTPQCYEDHGSPVRRARTKAAGMLPCARCGETGSPDLRKPRLFSQAWHRDPSSYFACPGCGLRLAVIPGAAADRPSQVASDRVPDPAGTLRTMISRDPRWFRSLTAADGSRSRFGLDTFLGDRLAGVEFRARCEVRVPPPPGSGGSGVAGRVEVPAVLLRHGMPWVVWGLESVERIVSPVPGFSQPDLISTLRVDSVEAAFAVAIDPEDRWQMTRIRLLERAGRDDRLRRPSRRC